jgi:hypothetical protein
MASTALMRAKLPVRVAVRDAVAEIAHGVGREGLEQLAPFGAIS